MSDTPAPKDPSDSYDEYLTELDIRSATMRDRFELLSEGDLSALLGVDPLTLTAWRKKNLGPAVAKLGRTVFYRRADVDSWIAQNVAPMKSAL